MNVSHAYHFGGKLAGRFRETAPSKAKREGTLPLLPREAAGKRHCQKRCTGELTSKAEGDERQDPMALAAVAQPLGEAVRFPDRVLVCVDDRKVNLRSPSYCRSSEMVVVVLFSSKRDDVEVQQPCTDLLRGLAACGRERLKCKYLPRSCQRELAALQLDNRADYVRLMYQDLPVLVIGRQDIHTLRQLQKSACGGSHRTLVAQDQGSLCHQLGLVTPTSVCVPCVFTVEMKSTHHRSASGGGGSSGDLRIGYKQIGRSVWATGFGDLTKYLVMQRQRIERQACRLDRVIHAVLGLGGSSSNEPTPRSRRRRQQEQQDDSNSYGDDDESSTTTTPGHHHHHFHRALSAPPPPCRTGLPALPSTCGGGDDLTPASIGIGDRAISVWGPSLCSPASVSDHHHHQQQQHVSPYDADHHMRDIRLSCDRVPIEVVLKVMDYMGSSSVRTMRLCSCAWRKVATNVLRQRLAREGIELRALLPRRPRGGVAHVAPLPVYGAEGGANHCIDRYEDGAAFPHASSTNQLVHKIDTLKHLLRDVVPSGRQLLASLVDEIKQEGNVHFQQNQQRLALACYTEALSLLDLLYSPSSTTPAEQRAKLLSNMAACYLKLGRTSEALRASHLALSLKPRHPKALFHRGRSYLAMRNLARARHDLRSLVRQSNEGGEGGEGGEGESPSALITEAAALLAQINTTIAQ
ncbi:unnamed protein product [Vitrella brassicaformis CCMP3155]|uniref:Uncharacterized protein n=2 Tax=Vitrella brassicaformis TaxID=1169539 RepID=A0A0G4ELL5_VITBC|nr:unnamed protein product [Vitrella brassicaformis CCMP3155]|eukprot:CEL97718.1 unnamed protein product [Vitrella brassicaformis CCMP3155]